MAAQSPRNQVIAAVRSWLGEGRLPPGSRLPAEQAIADEVGVARGTVRSALQELEQLGLVVSSERRGYRAAEAHRAPDPLLSGAVVLVSRITDEDRARGFSGVDSGFELGAFAAARAAGHAVIGLPPERLEGSAGEALAAARPLGVIAAHQVAAADGGRASLARLRRCGVPVVVNGDGEELADFDRVASDFAAGSAALVHHLARQGRRRILRLWSLLDRPYWLTARDAGYDQAVQACGLEALPAVAIPALSERVEDDLAVLDLRVRQYLGFLVEHLGGAAPVDALLLTTDSDVFPVAMACQLLGKEPGREVAVCGYDNYWPTCWEHRREGFVPTASIDRGNRQMGEIAVALLLERLGAAGPPLRRLVAPQLALPVG
jgi:DNA-binding LacI/PurR family transcriptional regulator